MAETMTVFNRRALRHHRDRAVRTIGEINFLLGETAARLADRLDDIKREFPLALDLGCRGSEIADALKGRGGVETLINADLSPAMAAMARGGPPLVCDEESLPLAPASIDLVLSNLSLHWVNDLPGALLQIRQTLKQDGLLLACMLGGDTLHELRTALYEAEMECEGCWSPRLSPLADVRDLGNLLQRTGFALPVADFETITVSYEHPLKLMHDLRAMGETNANAERRTTFSRRATLFRAFEIYLDKFTDEDGRVPATFEVITLTAWAPSPSQPKPLAPGSGQTLLRDALDT